MKKYYLLLMLLSTTVFISCDKEDSVDYTEYDSITDSNREVYINDEFETENARWFNFSQNGVTGTIENGVYHVRNGNGSANKILPAPIENIEDSDFEIEFRVKRMNRPSFNKIGLVWGYNVSSNQFYYFIISNQYGLSVKLGDYNNQLNEWRMFSGSDLDKYSVESLNYNKFTIRKIHNKYYFFVNEVFFGETKEDAPAFFGNHIGLHLGGDSEALYDYIKINYLKNLE